MSPPAVAKSIVAAICADPAGLSKPDTPAAEKPARSFSQTSALVNARQTTTADNVVAGDAKGGQRTVDKSTPSSGSALPGARAEKVTPASERTQGLEALMQAAGWDAQVRPASGRLGGGQAEKPMNLDGAAIKGLAPHGERSALSHSGGPLAETARSTLAKGLRESVAARTSGDAPTVSGKGGSDSTDKAMPSGGIDTAVEMISKQAARGGRNALASEKDLTAAKERAVEWKQVQTKATSQQDMQQMAEPPKGGVLQSSSTAVNEHAVGTKAIEPRVKSNVQERVEAPKSHGSGKTSASTKEHAVQPKPVGTQATIQANEEPNAQRLAESAKSHASRMERPVSPHPERMEAERGKSSPEALHHLQQGLRGTNSHDRSSPAGSGESAQARQAAGGTILPTDGKEASVSPAGDDLMTQAELAVSGADKSAVFSRLASDQTPTAGGLEASGAKGSAQSISEQIRDSLHASLDRGERQVVIRLHPPELGSVLVRFREQNEQIHGILEVSRSDTRHEVEQALPQVLRSLQEMGVQIRKFDVTVSDQSEKDSGRQQLHQDAWPQQQGSDRQSNRAQRSDFEFRISDSESPIAVGVPVGRIDMLA